MSAPDREELHGLAHQIEHLLIEAGEHHLRSPATMSTKDDDGVAHVLVYAWGEDAERVRKRVQH
jgi:hypothetical protein